MLCKKVYIEFGALEPNMDRVPFEIKSNVVPLKDSGVILVEFPDGGYSGSFSILVLPDDPEKTLQIQEQTIHQSYPHIKIFPSKHRVLFAMFKSFITRKINQHISAKIDQTITKLVELIDRRVTTLKGESLVNVDEMEDYEFMIHNVGLFMQGIGLADEEIENEKRKNTQENIVFHTWAQNDPFSDSLHFATASTSKATKIEETMPWESPVFDSAKVFLKRTSMKM